MTRDAPTSEVARQTVHVMVGALALPLRWLTWEQAAVLAGAGLLFNLVVLPRVVPGVFRPDERRHWYDSGIVLYPAAVLALVLLFPTRLDIAAIAWVILAAGDGMATLVGAHVRTARLPWNRDKSIGGLVAFVVSGSAAATAMAWWMGGSFAGGAGAWPLLWLVPAIAALAAAMTETVPIRLNDNLAVPAIAALVLWAFTFVEAEPIRAASALVASRAVPAVALNVAVAGLGYLAGTVTISGAVVGAIIGGAVFLGTGAAGWALLLASFLMASVTTRLGLRRKTAAGIAEARGGRRGPANAIANTSLAAFASLIALGMPDPRLAHLAMVTALATSASDTVASEVGKAWGRITWLVVGFRRVPAGTSGAVSVEGTAAGVGSALLLAWLAAGVGLISYEWTVGVAAAATIASLIEGVLGATFERSGVLNNDALNFVNAAIGAGLALVYVVWR